MITFCRRIAFCMTNIYFHPFPPSKYRLNHDRWNIKWTKFLISVAWVERELLHSTSLSLALDRPRLSCISVCMPPSAHAREIRKLISFIWYSVCRDSVCIIQKLHQNAWLFHSKWTKLQKMNSNSLKMQKCTFQGIWYFAKVRSYCSKVQFWKTTLR